MSEFLSEDRLVNLFAGGDDRGVCYQVNGQIRYTVGNVVNRIQQPTQLTSHQARSVAEQILLSLAARGEYGPEAINVFAHAMRRATRRTVRP